MKHTVVYFWAKKKSNGRNTVLKIEDTDLTYEYCAETDGEEFPTGKWLAPFTEDRVESGEIPEMVYAMFESDSYLDSKYNPYSNLFYFLGDPTYIHVVRTE